MRGSQHQENDVPLTEEQQAEVQAEVQRIAGGIRDEARTQGARDRETEISAYLAAEAEAQRLAGLEGEEKLKGELAAAETARVAAEASAARERLTVKIERRLTAAGVGAGIADDEDGAKAEAALARAVRMVDLPADADDAAIAAEIAKLRDEVPALFSTTGDGSTPPPGIPPAKQKKSTGGKTAAERAAERFASTQTPLAKSA